MFFDGTPVIQSLFFFGSHKENKHLGKKDSFELGIVGLWAVH